jgi:hypothetical protein
MNNDTVVALYFFILIITIIIIGYSTIKSNKQAPQKNKPKNIKSISFVDSLSPPSAGQSIGDDYFNTAELTDEKE